MSIELQNSDIIIVFFYNSRMFRNVACFYNKKFSTEMKKDKEEEGKE